MISKRAQSIDSSGIRRVFDLAAKLKDPINLSIGQPDFDAFPAVKDAAKRAIDEGKSAYTVTQGIPPLREKLRAHYALETHPGFDVFATAGVSGGLLLAYMTLLDPGDEILVPDPFFCMYRDLAYMVNAVPQYYDTYPDFALRLESIERAITPKTKAIVINTPGNPTGYACSQEEVDAVIELAKAKNIFVLYDEIYDRFCYDRPHPKVLESYDKLLVLNGFSKSAGVPGWRLGFVVGPEQVLQQMLKIQQYTIVCANSVGQWAMLAALDADFSELLAQYRAKRDFVVQELSGRYDFVVPGGAFYLFPKAPGGSGQKFVEQAIEKSLLIVPGNVFSRADTHFRISFSASQQNLERGVEVLKELVSREV